MGTSEKETPPQVTVVGSANLDVVVSVPHHPTTGETVLGGDHILVPGGKGANQAVAASRMGAEVCFVGRIGADEAGATLRTSLEQAGVQTSSLIVDADAPSGMAFITVDDQGENVIVVSPGSNSRVSPDDVTKAREQVASAAVLLLQLEIPMDAVTMAAQIATGTVILDPAPAPIDGLLFDLMATVDVLVPNTIELAQLTGTETGPDNSVDDLVAMARQLPVDTVVITRGADGALVIDPASHIEVPAPPVLPLDTTGAGDAFCGALAAAMAGGLSVHQAARLAVSAGSLAAARSGAQPSMPSAQEVERFMERALDQADGNSL